MKTTGAVQGSSSGRFSIDHRLAAYAAAAGAVGVTLASNTTSEAAVVGNATVQPFGINGDVNIDFNADGQIDFQIDHDRYNLNGTDLDYLQVDKNDFNSAANPLPISGTATFPLNGTTANVTGDSKYLTSMGVIGDYPAALTAGTIIGPPPSGAPANYYDFQEGDNFDSTGKTIRANRLIDEDHTQIDQFLNPAELTAVPTNGPNFLGLAGEVRYLGMRMNLNGAGVKYGWIGIRIDNEADATGAVVGYAYETTTGKAITAGVVPEPASLAMAVVGSFSLLAAVARKRFRGKRAN